MVLANCTNLSVSPRCAVNVAGSKANGSLSPGRSTNLIVIRCGPVGVWADAGVPRAQSAKAQELMRIRERSIGYPSLIRCIGFDCTENDRNGPLFIQSADTSCRVRENLK